MNEKVEECVSCVSFYRYSSSTSSALSNIFSSPDDLPLRAWVMAAAAAASTTTPAMTPMMMGRDDEPEVSSESVPTAWAAPSRAPGAHLATGLRPEHKHPRSFSEFDPPHSATQVFRWSVVQYGETPPSRHSQSASASAGQKEVPPASEHSSSQRATASPPAQVALV